MTDGVQSQWLVCVAWTVRLILLLFYLPVQLAGNDVRWIHAVDRWASDTVMRSGTSQSSLGPTRSPANIIAFEKLSQASRRQRAAL